MTRKEARFLEVGVAVRQLFHQLRAVAEHATPPVDGVTASHRAVMESLAAGGPQTVPALARARPVARQHIQVLVNDLLSLDLVELRPNPAHKRSSLVALTVFGARRFEAIRRVESKVLATLQLSLTMARLAVLARELGVLSADLSRWLSRHSHGHLGVHDRDDGLHGA